MAIAIDWESAPQVQEIHCVLLHNISWETYETLVTELEGQPATRLTYDNGLLEIRTPMAPLIPHERNKKLLGRLVEVVTEEQAIEICSLGSFTCKRQDLAKGLEPDQCYYIQNEPLVRGKDELDLTQDPPPDLAIEIDITSSSMNRMTIYAALGVPELWRFENGELKMYQLNDKAYQETSSSPTFPNLSVSDIMRFLEMKQTMGETTWIREFRQWVREHKK